jgi:Tfp pilus assembly PilM family ATPase
MAKGHILALNFDNDSIKFIEFEQRKGNNIIHVIGEKKLPENSCKNAYGIFDSEKVEEGLKELLKEYKIKATKATYLIPEKSVIKKTTMVPKTSTNKEIYKLIKRNSKQYTGESSDNIYFDFYTHDNEKTKKKDVYILAVPKEVVEKRDQALISCGLSPQVADLPSAALNRVNHFVREAFYKETHQTLLDDEFTVFVRKENNIYNAMIFDQEQKESLQILEDSLQEAIDEIESILEENKVKDKFGGFVFFDLDKETVNLENENYIFTTTLLDSKVKSKNKVNLESQEWLALSGLVQRERNEY